MATPTFTHDLTTISDAETTINWVAVGGAMLALDPDTKIQSSNSLGVPATASTVVGAVFNRGSTVDLTNKHLYIWVNNGISAAVASFAAGGIRIRVAGSTATNYGEWFVGGNDVPWCGKGWRLIVVDCNRAFDATGGTPPSITAIQHIGVTALCTITLMFGYVINIDMMRYGTKVAISGGTDGDPVTLQNIVDQDFDGDPVNNVFGIVTKNRAGTFEINGELRIGIESGAGDTVFSSQNELIIFQDQPCALDYLKIFTQQGSGTTKFRIGTGTGTGDSRVGLNGSVFDRINSVHGREYSLDLDASINLVELFGSTVLRAKRGVTLPAATGHEVISTSFVSCGQVDIGRAVTRKCVFSGHGLLDTRPTTLNVAANPVDTGNITVTVVVATRTYTRSAGSYLTDGFAPGMVVTWSGFTNANNNGAKVIQSVTATVMTVTSSLVLVAETGGGDERAVVPFGYTRSAGSFVSNGFLAGQSIEVSGFTTSGNNGTRIITTVGATLITLKQTTGMATESGGGDERIQLSGVTSNGALLWNESIDLKTTSFLGNTNTTTDATAIQHPTTTAAYTYDALTFAGNSYDVNNATNFATYASYSESNQDGTTTLNSGGITGAGQSFTGSGGYLSGIKLYLKKTGLPTGNAVAKIYAHSGTFGTSSIPTGAALATSDNLNVASLTTSLALVPLTFSGANHISLTNTTNYVLTLEYSGGDGSNNIQVGYDGSSPSHGGNYSTFSGSWTADSAKDMCFYVFSGAVITINSANLSNPGTYIHTAGTFGTTSIYSYNANTATYTDETTDINSAGADDVVLPPIQTTTQGDAIYFGSDFSFSGVTLDLRTAGVYSNITLNKEYWNGAAWTSLTVTDTSSGFTTTGIETISFTVPTDWAMTSVNSVNKFWIRFRASWTSGQSITTAPLATQGFIGKTVINNAVTLTVTVKDANSSAVENAQVAIFKTSDDSQLMNEDTNASGIASESYNYAGDTAIYIRVRKSSTGATKYVPVSTTGTITSSGFSVTVTLTEDTNA